MTGAASLDDVLAAANIDMPEGCEKVAVRREEQACDLLGRIRSAGRTSASVIVVMDPAVEQPDRAMLIAAIAPLAIELAPEARLSLIDLRPGYAIADLLAVIRFLAGARSTTGQVLAVGS